MKVGCGILITIKTQGLRTGWTLLGLNQVEDYHLLAGAKGSRMLQEGLKEWFPDKETATWVRVLTAATTTSMVGKTVGSPQAVVRNFLGNVAFLLANDNIRLISNPKGTAAAFTKALHTSLNRFDSHADKDAMNKRINRYIELGILKESTSARVMQELADLSFKLSETKDDSPIWEKIFSSSFEVAKSLYSSADDF